MQKKSRDELFTKSQSLRDFLYILSLNCINVLVAHGCMMNFLNRLFYLKNRARCSRLYMPICG